MVNPIKKMNRNILRRLSCKQKVMVKKLRQSKKVALSQLGVYKRANSNSGYSIRINKRYKRKQR